MRSRLLVVVAVLGMAATVFPAAARPAPPQKETGSIALAAAYTDGSCFFGLHRRINLVAQRSVQGVVGYDFDVDASTVGKRFKLTPSDPSADLDIAFYSSIGDMGDPAGAPGNFGFETRKPGGEKGKVPAGFPIAIVCMVSGGPNVGFTYKAG